LIRRDVADALRFFTALPLPEHEARDFAVERFAWAAPVAGAAVGLVGALGLATAHRVGLPPFVAAALAVASLIGAAGGLHEDGLADVADGFGGGGTRERKLAIMRDSRIGAFGAVALVLALMIRVGALSALLAQGLSAAAGGLVLAAAASRAGALTPLALLPPARSDGAGAAAGRLPLQSLGRAWCVALALALIIGFAATGLAAALAALAGAAVGAAAMTALARAQIGGQTGDVAGAAQQWAEIAALCGLLIGRSQA
jgi:adenosylcobinamide-GDP ribazoletransferase